MVNSQKVPRAKPQTSRYSAITAFISLLSAPSAALPVVEYAAARPSVGSCSMPKDSQKTQNRPHTIMGKNWLWIHRKIVDSSSSTGPVKKKMPLAHRR